MAKKIPVLHHLFSSFDKDKQEDIKLLQRHLKSEDFTPEEYVNLLSGRYENHSAHDLGRLFEKPGEDDTREWSNEKNDHVPVETDKGLLIDHPHNKPENNRKAVLELLKQHEKALKDEKHQDFDRRFKHHETGERLRDAARLPLESGDLVDLAGVHELGTSIAENPNMDKETVSKIVNRYRPSEIPTAIMRHPEFDKTHARKILRSRLDVDNDRGRILAEKRLLEPHHAKKFLDQHDLGESSHYMDNLLDHLSPEDRKEFLNRKVGITGGSHQSPKEEDESEGDFSERNWENWDSGPDAYDRKRAAVLASSRHLDDEHAEHIKRHGTPEEKIALYQNEHIDPKHGAEMWRNWDSDDHDKGYDIDNLRDHYRKENEDNFYEDFNDEATDAVQNQYSLEDYMRDAGFDHMYDDDDIHKELESGNYETTAPNPDFDSSEPEHPENNPKHIDFADRSSGGGHSYELKDHPDYDELKTKADQALQEKNGTPDRIYEGYDESIRDDVYRKAQELFDEDVENHHLEEKNLPKHLRGKIPEIKEGRRRKINSESRDALTQLGLDQPYRKDDDESNFGSAIQLPGTHEYAPGQHHMEMAEDYAKSSGGSIDIGTLNKLHPNQKDHWKSLFGGKGKLSSEEIRTKINDLPKTKYNVSYGMWNGHKMQNLNRRDELVARLDHSEESYKPFLDDPELASTFSKVQNASQRSGHPTNDDTIAWARIDTSDPKHWMVDELQSDFSSALRSQIENAEVGDSERKADVLAKLKKIESAHKDWRETLLNHVIKMAKRHGAEAISTHSPESKASHTGAENIHSVYKDSYQKIPRSMGFQPAEVDSLPLSDAGKEVFQQKQERPRFTEAELQGKSPDEYLLEKHKEAMGHHSVMYRAHSRLKNHNLFSEDAGEFLPGPPDEHAQMLGYHRQKFEEHKEKVKQLDPSDASIKRATPENVPGSDFSPEVHTPKAIESVRAKRDLYAPIADAFLKTGEILGALKGHTLRLVPAAMKKAEAVFEEVLSYRHRDLRQKAASVLTKFRGQKDGLA